MTQGSLWRVSLRLSLPMVAQGLLQNLFAIADMLFVGRLGPAAVAAVGMSGNILGVLWMLVVGITTGCTALVAQAIGAGQTRRAELATAQALVMGLVLSALCLLAVPLAAPALAALGAAPAVVREGTPYLQISIGGAFTMLLSVTFSSALRGAGDATTPLKMMAIGNAVNIALDPLLIFGLWGLPALGVAGSAWATLIARLVATVLLARVFFGGAHAHFHLRPRDLRPDGRTIGQMVQIGIFSSGQMLVRNISGVVLMRVVAIYGTTAVAAYTIGLRLWLTFMMPGFGFGNAASTLVGQNLGAGRVDRAARAGWVVTFLYAALGVVVGAGFAVFAGPLVAAFNDAPPVVAQGRQLLHWLGPSFVFLAFSVVLGRAMNGAGDTFWPMVITAVAVLPLRIPLAYGLASWLDSATGVWISLAASNVVQGVLFAAAFVWGRWQAIGRQTVRAGLARD